MYGCVVTPPVTPEADLGVLFTHNEGYSTMCGHGIIALTTALLESGALPARGPRTPVTFDTPAGLVRATGHLDDEGSVRRVSFLNVPSFLAHRDLSLDIRWLGAVTVDIAFGGAFYAILPARAVGMSVAGEHLRGLCEAAAAIKRAVNDSVTITHPDEADLGFLYGVIFTGEPEGRAHHSRNLCVFADGEVDRSPTGTGVSARLASHHAKGEIEMDQTLAIESILGERSVFEGRVVETARTGAHDAIVPEVSGTAFLTGRHEFILDPADPLAGGFLVR